MAKGNKMDPELLAMRHIQAILDDLDNTPARTRVMSFINARLQDERAQIALPLMGTAVRQD